MWAVAHNTPANRSVGLSSLALLICGSVHVLYLSLLGRILMLRTRNSEEQEIIADETLGILILYGAK